MFEKTCFVLAPYDHGAILLVKLINAHPKLTGSTDADTYPTNAFDQVSGCGVRYGACPYCRGVGADFGAGLYQIDGIVALARFSSVFGGVKKLLLLQPPQGVPQPSPSPPH